MLPFTILGVDLFIEWVGQDLVQEMIVIFNSNLAWSLGIFSRSKLAPYQALDFQAACGFEQIFFLFSITIEGREMGKAWRAGGKMMVE